MINGNPPLIFFSGMGADERVFAPQHDAFPQLIVPRWIDPSEGETLPAYAARIARRIDPGRPFYIGGTSFGGMVAVEAAHHLPGVLGCMLIGSVRSSKELPRRITGYRRAAQFAHLIPFRWLSRMAGSLGPLGERLCSRATQGMMQQVADSDPGFLCWACEAVLRWDSSRNPTFPIHQIHGDRDPILPWHCTKPDVLVRGGGHVLTLSHPKEVNDFLRSRAR